MTTLFWARLSGRKIDNTFNHSTFLNLKLIGKIKQYCNTIIHMLPAPWALKSFKENSVDKTKLNCFMFHSFLLHSVAASLLVQGVQTKSMRKARDITWRSEFNTRDMWQCHTYIHILSLAASNSAVTFLAQMGAVQIHRLLHISFIVSVLFI